MGGDKNETEVRNLSESMEMMVVLISIPSRVTRGFRGGVISLKNAATTDTCVPPDALNVEGEKEIMEATGCDGNTERENDCTMPLYLRVQDKSLGPDIGREAIEYAKN